VLDLFQPLNCALGQHGIGITPPCITQCVSGANANKTALLHLLCGEFRFRIADLPLLCAGGALELDEFEMGCFKFEGIAKADIRHPITMSFRCNLISNVHQVSNVAG
jgi:hypothetical protein